MPALTQNSGSLVLVTGASGFLGTHTIPELLDLGFKVRATVRSEEKGKFLLSLYPGGDVSYAIVPDMNDPGAYDQAVVGVEAVIHMASPVDLTNTGEPSLVIDPAVQGVLGLLNSIKEHGTSVKRVIDVGSIVSVGDISKPGPRTFTEADWADDIVESTLQQGKDASGIEKYIASKVVAEHAFWDYFKEQRPSFDGTAILPGAIFGPRKQFGAVVTGSVELMLPWVQGPVPEEQLSGEYFTMVHVTDVARATARALITPEASGERFIVAAELLFGNDIALAAAEFPELWHLNLTKGKADPAFREDLASRGHLFDGSKAAKIFNIEWIGRHQALRESIETTLPVLHKAA